MKPFAWLAAVGLLCAAAAPAAAKFDSTFIADGIDLSSYDTVMIVTESEIEGDSASYPNSRSDYSLAPEDWTRQEETLMRYLSRELGRVASIADSAGPGVLVVKVTLTDIRPSRPLARHLGSQRGGYRPGLGGAFLGGAAARVEATDAASGEVVARFVDKDYRETFNDGRGVTGTWDDAVRAYAKWSRDLRNLVD